MDVQMTMFYYTITGSTTSDIEAGNMMENTLANIRSRMSENCLKMHDSKIVIIVIIFLYNSMIYSKADFPVVKFNYFPGSNKFEIKLSHCHLFH